MSLIAFLAWVGLGADGLSSSAYGPEEAFKALGNWHDLVPGGWGEGGPLHEGVGAALSSLGDWLIDWRGHRQDLIAMEVDGNRVLVVVHQTGEQRGVRKDEEIGVLFFVGPDERVEKWEPWLDL